MNLKLNILSLTLGFNLENTPSLAAPATVKLSLVDGHDDVKVTWSKVPNASGYSIYYRNTSSSSSYTLLGRTTKTTYTKTDLADATKYYFRIIPYYTVDSKIYESDYYKTAAIYTLRNLAAPSKVTLSLADGYDDVKVSWSKVTNADGYYVYYKKASSSSYTLLGETTKTTYTKTNLADATKYNFRIIPYYIVNSKIYKDDSYKTASIYTLRNLAAPSKVSLSLYGYDDVKVSWSKVTNADGYYVYYKKASSSSYTLLGKTTKTSCTKANLADGVKYYFRIIPYYIVDSKIYKDDSYKTAAIYTLKKVSTPTVSKYNSKRTKLSWSNIEGESGYEISMSTSKTGTNVVLRYATTTGKAKTFTPQRGKNYYYKIRAYKVVNNTRIYAPWSDVKSYTLK